MKIISQAKNKGIKGDCFAAITDDSDRDAVMIANIGRKSLQAICVPFPLDGEMRGKLFYVTDERIPKEAYRTGELCFCMGGGPMMKRPEEPK